MNIFRLVIAALMIFSLLAGCAQVPKESVELSATLGRDLQEVQRSHRQAIELLFDRELERITNYLENVATPTFISFAIRGVGPQISQSLIAANAPNASFFCSSLAFGAFAAIRL